MTEQLDGRRAIGERNAEAILDAAIGVLAADRGAGMGAVAAAAGVGRATLYRHFPTRESLVEALRDRVRAQAQAALDAARLDEGDAVEALRRFIDALWTLRDAHAAIEPPDGPEKERRAREFWKPMLGFVRRAQAAGTIDPALEPSFVLAVLQGVLRATVAEVEAGRLARGKAVDRALDAFLHGTAAHPR